jgi:competence protein ComEC
MLMESPACLYDSGFLMSFMAVAGAAWVLPGITGIVESIPGFQWLGEESAEKTAVAGSFFQTKGKNLLRKGRKAGVKMLLASAAIQLTTLPVTLWFYGEVSLAGIFLNLLILPTAGIVLISAFSTALLGFAGIVRGGSIWILISAAKMTAIPGRLFVHLYETMSRMASGLPFCTWIGGRPALWQCAMYYLLLACAVFSAYQYRFRTKNTWVLKGGQLIRFVYKCSFFILLLLALPGICFRNRSLFQIAFLDVGQGDGIVIRTPDGQSFMIDGGSSGKKNLAKYQLMPYLKNQGISYVDAIFISHTDLDHISGVLQLLETISSGLTTIRVGTLVLPDWKDPPDTWTELAKAAWTAGAKVVTGHRGDVFQGKDVQFRIISPQSGVVTEDLNEAGMVMEMTYGNFKALFTGDIGEGTENELLTDGQLEDVDVLKVAHHGSRFSSSDLFLKAVHAETAVISCSENNTYGHPAPETVDRLNEAGCRVEYTMKSGAVTIQTDGERIKVERYIQIKG